MRCPNCGVGAVFSGPLDMHDRCPNCTYRYEREHGYFLGAMVINFIVASGLMFASAIAAYLLTRDRTVTVVVPVVVTIIAVPGLLRHSRTLWMAIDLAAEPPRDDEFRPTEVGKDLGPEAETSRPVSG